ncbi:MAG TPA: EF-hand domain-containing protein [Sphingobium sp.]
MKLIAAAIAALSLPGLAAAQAPADPVKTYIDAGFAAMDANKDGRVDPAEFDTFMRARLARQGTAFDQAYSAIDKNGDGRIDRKEAAANGDLLANYDAIDANGDGVLAKDEIRSAAIAAQAAEAGAQ